MDDDERREYYTNIKKIYIKLEEVLTILLENNADPYLKNNKGETIFDIAKENIQIINSIKKVIRDVIYTRKKIAIDAYMRSKNLPSLPSTDEHPLSGFYHSNIDDPDNIMEQVLNMAYGEDEEENEGAEESKSNRDAGSRRKSKSKTRKSGGRKKSRSKRRKSKNKRRKSIRKKSRNRKSGSKRKKSIRKKSGSRRKKSKSKRRKSSRK